MSPLFPGDVLLALEDSRPEAGAPGAGRRFFARCLGFSLALHLATAAMALGLSHVYAAGEQTPSGPEVITVSLVAGLGGEDLGGGGGPTLAKAAPEPFSPPADEEQARPDSPPVDTDIIPLPKEPASPPELKKLEAAPPELKAPLRKPAEKVPPAPPKTTAAKPRKSSAPPQAQARPPAQGGGGSAVAAGAGAGSGSGRAAGGGGGDAAGYMKGNYEYIKKRIRQYLVYSPQAKRMGIQGAVTVAFTIGPDGQARNISVVGTSGHGSLDESALQAVRNASPFPSPPAPARITVPVIFSLK